MTTNNPLPMPEIRTTVANLRDKYVKLERNHWFRSENDRLLKCDDEDNLLPNHIRFTARLPGVKLCRILPDDPR